VAVPRARAWALAVGVPAIFAVLAALLWGLSAPATAAPKPAEAPATSVAAPSSVVRSLVRPTGPRIPVLWRLRPQQHVVFVTIDDGVTKDRAALRYVEAHRLPVTAFLTAWTVKGAEDYFTRITRWGGIANHSATHASLARSTTDLDHEICYTQKALAKAFGEQPRLMRPPYGQGYSRMETQVTARRCGIEQMVMWDAVVDKGRLSITNGRLEAGDVILLHFTDNLAKDLQVAMRAARKAGLTPANLADYVPAGSAGTAETKP
jgi:peptidoglycan/xylan/chitin deacetylase (PgdA/CDA1 family)